MTTAGQLLCTTMDITTVRTTVNMIDTLEKVRWWKWQFKGIAWTSWLLSWLMATVRPAVPWSCRANGLYVYKYAYTHVCMCIYIYIYVCVPYDAYVTRSKSFHIIPYHITSYHTVSYHNMSYHMILYEVILCYVTLECIMRHCIDVIWNHTMLCCIVLHDVRICIYIHIYILCITMYLY